MSHVNKKPKVWKRKPRLIPDSMIRRELEVSAVTLWRWTRDRGFPPVVRLGGKNYRDFDLYEAYLDERCEASNA